MYLYIDTADREKPRSFLGSVHFLYLPIYAVPIVGADAF